MSKEMKRPHWDEYFIQMADLAATRSTCLRRKVGAVIVKDRNVLATGYNGVPSGLQHCDQTGCLRDKLNVPSGQRHEICRGLHAEQNAIIQAAKHGVCIEGADIYITDSPCSICSKMVLNSNLQNVYYDKGYPDELAMDMLSESNINVQKLNRER